MEAPFWAVGEGGEMAAVEAARRRRLTEDLGAGVGALLPPTAGPASTDGEKERQAGARSPGRKKAKRAKQKKDPAKKAKLVSKEEEGEPAREPPRARVEVAPQTQARRKPKTRASRILASDSSSSDDEAAAQPQTRGGDRGSPKRKGKRPAKEPEVAKAKPQAAVAEKPRRREAGAGSRTKPQQRGWLEEFLSCCAA